MTARSVWGKRERMVGKQKRVQEGLKISEGAVKNPLDRVRAVKFLCVNIDCFKRADRVWRCDSC